MRLHNLLCIGGMFAAIVIWAAEPTLPADLHERVSASVDAGAEYLLKTQNENGSWGTYQNPHPAIAGLGAMAIHNAPGLDQVRVKEATDRAMNFLLQYRQPNGSIYPAEWDQRSSANYPNYTTSVALLAMATINRPEYREAMIAARNYLKSSQFNDPSKVDYGGIGYGHTGRADLSNGAWATAALYYTEYLDKEDAATEKSSKEMWEKMAIFLTKCQNLPETNKESYVSEHAEDRGGFIYRPFESKAGDRAEGEGGDQSALISSGSMTYAGLMSMLYARVDRQDPRVRGAIGYLTRNWTLSENPGMGLQGLYYYLYIMSRALDAYGEPVIADAAGKQHTWREDVAKQLMALQNVEGSWANRSGRYMESMPELATSYALMGLKTTLGLSSLEAPRE